jgi:hypothetical protein
MAEKIFDLYNRPLPEHPAWISGGVLPKSGIMLMGGAAKIGKTFLLLDLAHNLATGGKLWGMTDYEIAKPVPTIYCEQEVGEMEFQRRVKNRYRALDAAPPENFFYTSRLKDFFLDTNTGQKILANEIASTKAKVAIIDPVSRCMLGNENDNSEVGGLFRRLDELLIDIPDLSIVLAHHFGKPPKNEEDMVLDTLSPYNFRGASRWFDCPDTLITLQRIDNMPGEWRRLVGAIEMRQGENPEGKLKFAILSGGIVKPVVSAGALKPAHAAWR